MKKSILVVDDERELGILLAEAVQEAHVHQVITGTEAISYLSENRPEMILLDLQLPEVNGMEILKHIRSQGLNSVVVMITAFATVETAVEAMKIGANDFLCKPIQIHELQRMVKHYLEGTTQLQNKRAASLEDVEKKHISAVLIRNNGNRRKTADDLEISLRTLYYKIKQYDLES